MRRVLIVDYADGAQSTCIPFDVPCAVDLQLPGAAWQDRIRVIRQDAAGRFVLSLAAFDRSRGWLKGAEGVDILRGEPRRDVEEVELDDVTSAHLCAGATTVILAYWPDIEGIQIVHA